MESSKCAVGSEFLGFVRETSHKRGNGSTGVRDSPLAGDARSVHEADGEGRRSDHRLVVISKQTDAFQLRSRGDIGD